MADIADDIRDSLEKQIADLKKEVTKIGKSVAARASDVVDDAEGALDEVGSRAGRAVGHVRHQAHVAADAARENPGTATTVLAAVVLLGLAVGFVLGEASAANRRR